MDNRHLERSLAGPHEALVAQQTEIGFIIDQTF
jgi:hypothetical protein